MKKITIIGGGVLGSQIAFQTAYCNFDVTIWLRSEESKQRTQIKLDDLKKTYIETINRMDTPEGKTIENWDKGIVGNQEFNKEDCLRRVDTAYNSIKIDLDLTNAVKDADLVIESLTEDFDTKKEFFKKVANLMDPKTIIVTNSSTFLPSKLAKYTGRSNKFFGFHFSNSIWKNNVSEVMAHKYTDMNFFVEVVRFAEEINMVALPVRKEKAGYLINSMLLPFMFSALDLYANGVSDVESIDKAWILGTGAPKGPFQILDTVGLKIAYDIIKLYLKIPSFLAPYNFKAMAQVLEKYMSEGKMGKISGEGFYKYN